MPKCCHQPIGKEVQLPSNNWQKSGNFRLFPLNCCISVYILLKVEEALENFKNAQRFFSYFCSSQLYHL
jgi:hypothetical protein